MSQSVCKDCGQFVEVVLGTDGVRFAINKRKRMVAIGTKDGTVKFVWGFETHAQTCDARRTTKTKK